MKIAAEYIWFNKHFNSISKTLFIDIPEDKKQSVNILNELMNIKLYSKLYLPESITLVPISVRIDPFRKSTNVIVLCEEEASEESNRSVLEKLIKEKQKEEILYEYKYDFCLNTETNSSNADETNFEFRNFNRNSSRKEAEHIYHLGLESGLAFSHFHRGKNINQWSISVGQNVDIRIADDIMFLKYFIERICEVHNLETLSSKNTISLSYGKTRNKEIDCKNIAESLLQSLNRNDLVISKNTEGMYVIQGRYDNNDPYTNLLNILK